MLQALPGAFELHHNLKHAGRILLFERERNFTERIDAEDAQQLANFVCFQGVAAAGDSLVEG